jgi:ubiquinone/menaquinone biosynthesis C-methylase UbiE
MLARARLRQRQLDNQLVLLRAPAEQLPFAADAFDTVVGTFVMCTVASPAQALSEINRVLRPGGLYLFIEHVRADSYWPRLLQDLLTPLWQVLARGCRLNRNLLVTAKQQGFELIELSKLDVGSLLLPLVIGKASKTGTVDIQEEK